jgi:hypothetical protein
MVVSNFFKSHGISFPNSSSFRVSMVLIFGMSAPKLVWLQFEQKGTTLFMKTS